MTSKSTKNLGNNGRENEDDKENPNILLALRTAEGGSPMKRLKFGKLSTSEVVKLSADHTCVHYCIRSSCLPAKFKDVKLTEILEIRNGWNTDAFHKASAKTRFTSKIRENCCFSVIFRHAHILRKSVDLITDTPEIQNAWVVALRFLVTNIKKETLHFNEEKWLKQKFIEADENKNGTLSFNEIYSLLTQLNLEISYQHAKMIFRKADIRKDPLHPNENALDIEEFLLFFQYLTKRADLLNVLRAHSTNNTVYFSPSELKNFIENVQKAKPISVEDCEKLIKKYEPEEPNREELMLTSQGFRKLLLTEEYGAMYDPAKIRVFQDMTLPLNNYYINSSHNTYLCGHQLHGESTIEGYITALKQGYKLLELDVWDGVSEPMITHGLTLVNPIRLRDVVKAIEKYAFFVSPYPVILSVENHCSVSQQSIMVDIFKDILGRALFTPQENLTEFPSPEQLKEKFLIKTKIAKFESPCGRILAGRNENEDELEENKNGDNNEVNGANGDSDNETKGRFCAIDKKEHKKIKVINALNKITALPNAKIHDLSVDIHKHPFNGFATLVEGKVKNVEDSDYQDFVKYVNRHFVKTYPGGTRFDSSNYNPVPFWNTGIQAVSLNAQTADESTDLNDGFFRMNGNCGYILKPEILRIGLLNLKDYSLKKPAMKFEIRVISAQYLPKPTSTNHALFNDIVDPFVTLEIFGLPCDNQKVKTKVISNNGFNPVWDECFILTLKAPEFALLRFCVKDFDVALANDFIGEYTLPVSILKQGYAHIRLRTGFAHITDPTAVLFVHLKAEDISHL